MIRSSKSNIQPSTVQVSTTWGSIAIDLIGRKVVGCRLPFLEKIPQTLFSIESSGKDAASRFVVAALTGKTATMPPIGKPDGTVFQQEVWRSIAQIPPDTTKTYGELAKAIGRPRAHRAVANACGKNPLPIFIPCHRVVAANGKIGGFSSGLPWKRLLLTGG